MIYISQIQHLEKARKFPAGTVLVHEGQSDEMLILLRGSAAVERSGSDGVYARVEMLGPGEYFGECSLLLGEPSDKRLIAVSDVIVLPVTKRGFMDFIQKEPYVALSLMTDMTRRTFELNQKLLPYLDLFPLINNVKTDAAEQYANANLKNSEPGGDFRADMPLTEPRSVLFPPGHGRAVIDINNDNDALLMEKGYTCPICKHTFRTLRVKKSKLLIERTDADLRVIYKGIEPLHYDVVTCPNCLYSALEESFTEGRKIKPDLIQILEVFKNGIPIGLGMARDSQTVFAGYYLAVLCAPRCFMRPALSTSKLLVKLSRLYRDAGREDMERYITEQALAAYVEAYENIDLDAPQSQQVCVMIGELNYKLGNITDAKKFFFRAKSEINVSPEMTRHAEQRLDDMRVLEDENK